MKHPLGRCWGVDLRHQQCSQCQKLCSCCSVDTAAVMFALLGHCSNPAHPELQLGACTAPLLQESGQKSPLPSPGQWAHSFRECRASGGFSVSSWTRAQQWSWVYGVIWSIKYSNKIGKIEQVFVVVVVVLCGFLLFLIFSLPEAPVLGSVCAAPAHWNSNCALCWGWAAPARPPGPILGKNLRKEELELRGIALEVK